MAISLGIYPIFRQTHFFLHFVHCSRQNRNETNAFMPYSSLFLLFIMKTGHSKYEPSTEPIASCFSVNSARLGSGLDPKGLLQRADDVLMLNVQNYVIFFWSLRDDHRTHRSGSSEVPINFNKPTYVLCWAFEGIILSGVGPMLGHVGPMLAHVGLYWACGDVGLFGPMLGLLGVRRAMLSLNLATWPI